MENQYTSAFSKPEVKKILKGNNDDFIEHIKTYCFAETNEMVPHLYTLKRGALRKGLRILAEE